MTYVQLDRARRRLAELDQLLGDVCGATVAGRRQLGAGLHGRPDLAAAERAGLSFVAEHIVSRVMPRRRPEPSQTWRTLLADHIGDFVSIDFFTVPSVASVSSSFWLCLPITAAWTAQQLVDAFPEQSAPAYLLWDRDQVYVRDTSPDPGAVGGGPAHWRDMARHGLAEARCLLRGVLVGRLIFTPVPRPPDLPPRRGPGRKPKLIYELKDEASLSGLIPGLIFCKFGGGLNRT